MSRATYPRHSDYKEISKNPAKKLISSDSNERLHRTDTMTTNKPVRRILEKENVGNIRYPIGKSENTRGLRKNTQKNQRNLKQKLLETLHRFTKAALTRKSPEFRRPKNERVEERLRKSHTYPMKIHPLEDCLRVE